MGTPCPRIVVAGAHSGVGKTSTTLALVRALSRRGLKVQTFKIGPDYLDPSYLEIASGRPCYNLDSWMSGKDYVCDLFATKAAGADVAVVEGVMGLFDGSDPVLPTGSTAEIAVWLQAPVLLVINVHGMARSVSALVKGFAEFDPNLQVAGVVANHCGSDRHAYWLGESLKAFDLPPIVASPPRGIYPELPSRHLGLVTANERTLSHRILDQLADAVEEHGSLSHIETIARNAPNLSTPSVTDDRNTISRRARLGVAYDSAFHFYYPDNLEALERAGCEVIRFSPLSDESLPKELNGIYIGGGYPEEYAEELSANLPMIQSVRSFAESGGPLYAECGGLMYLSQGIESADGKGFDMAGILPARTRMLSRLKTLGYVEVTLTEESLFGKAGDQVRGHEFHYSELIGDPLQHSDWNHAYQMKRVRSQVIAKEGYQQGRILASYVHAHFASRPDAVDHFVSLCASAQ
jgi:cobyrinic acid a,c-diamide synthase